MPGLCRPWIEYANAAEEPGKYKGIPVIPGHLHTCVEGIKTIRFDVLIAKTNYDAAP